MIIHHHHHRFEKKIKIRERSQRRSIFYETTAEHICWEKPTSLVCKKKTKTSLKKKERKNKKERVAFFVPSAWLGARKAFQPTLCVYSILCTCSSARVFNVFCFSLFSSFSKKNSQTLNNVFSSFFCLKIFSFPFQLTVGGCFWIILHTQHTKRKNKNNAFCRCFCCETTSSKTASSSSAVWAF